MKRKAKSNKRKSSKAKDALRLQIKRQTGIRKLRGKIQWEGDLESSRLGRIMDIGIDDANTADE